MTTQRLRFFGGPYRGKTIPMLDGTTLWFRLNEWNGRYVNGFWFDL